MLHSGAAGCVIHYVKQESVDDAAASLYLPKQAACGLSGRSSHCCANGHFMSTALQWQSL